MTDIQQIILITGASRGLGAEIARQILKPSVLCIHIGRQSLPELERQAAEQQAQYQEWLLDLGQARDIQKIASLMASVPTTADRYWLINNAGTVEPIAQVPSIHFQDMVQAFHTNTLAPIALSQAFCHHLAHVSKQRRIVNISSGAGRTPVSGWGVYCASKAAIDRFSEVLKLEQGDNGIQVVALAPGVIDTNMQATIRNSSASQFPAVDRFKSLKLEQALSTPKAVAEKIIRYLQHTNFGQKVIDDIREFN